MEDPLYPVDLTAWNAKVDKLRIEGTFCEIFSDLLRDFKVAAPELAPWGLRSKVTRATDWFCDSMLNVVRTRHAFVQSEMLKLQQTPPNTGIEVFRNLTHKTHL